MVLTVEPGIYIAAESLGVRIEDDVLVTADGCRVLSDGVPRDPDAIEALMTRDRAGSRPFSPLPPRDAVTPTPGGSGEPQGERPPRRFRRPR